jgi:hypothetical protein
VRVSVITGVQLCEFDENARFSAWQ